jgi:hypothetical protein
MLGLFVSSFLKHLSSRIMLYSYSRIVSGPIKLRCPPSNDGYLVFLYEQTLVFEMRNQSAVRRVVLFLMLVHPWNQIDWRRGCVSSKGRQILTVLQRC